ncbi:MAG: hypothetical protein WC132_03505 [Methanomethylophilus sp.]
MDVQILKTDRVSSYGSSVVTNRPLDNKSLPLLDLLVREAVQNSLDAAEKNEPNSKVTVAFSTGQFQSNALTKYLGCYFEDRLNKRYGSKQYDFIAVKDSGTKGLTGDSLNDGDHSNLQKLVYNIAQSQTKHGSGGSHGQGKIVYYSLGKGPVFFYSHIPLMNEGRSLLAAAFIENERDVKNRIIDYPNNRGIAFFGNYILDGTTEGFDRKTIPITDEQTIADILSVFHIDRYKPDEYGTTIIVAYTDSEKLLNETRPNHDDGERDPLWTRSIEEYLTVAIQRWYAPRLRNKLFPGAWLKASVNGKDIKDQMKPFFKLIRALYNQAGPLGASSSKLDGDEIFKIDSAPIACKDLNPTIAGHMSWIKISPTSLKMTTERYNNIYALAGQYDATPGMPIITYTRGLGMIINYTTDSSPWMPRTDELSEDSILVALFRSDPHAQVARFNNDLEEYLKNCECADHYNWNDTNGISVIKSISGSFSRRLNSVCDKKTDEKSERDQELSNRLAKMLLPAGGFRCSTNKTTKNRNDKRMSIRNCQKLTRTRFSSFDSSREKDGLSVNFELQISSEKTRAFVTVIGERDSLNCDEWEKEICTKFPLEMKIRGNGLHVVDKYGNNTDRCVKYTNLRTDKTAGSAYGIMIETTEFPVIVRGSFFIHSDLPNLSINVVCEEVKTS